MAHSDGSTESYGYRVDGELMAAANGSASVVFERDALGRVVKEKQGPHSVESEYGPLGLRTRMRSSLGVDQSIERNQMGDVLEVKGSGYAAQFKRDALGLELERALPGGVKSRWDRDKLGRPTQHVVEGPDKVLRAVGYKWGANDRLRMLLDGMKGPTEYGHDALGNLAWAKYADGTAELRMPDAVGNLFRTEVRADRKYGPAGQLLEVHGERGVTRYAYDPEGNLIQKTEPNGRIWTYAWNASGMLSEVTRPDGTVVRFEYDALGRRVKKVYRGQTTHWVWDGNNPLHEWVEGKLQPEREPEVIPLWSADPAIKKREAELSAFLSQGPPERGSKQAPITWLFEPDSFAPMAKLVGEAQYSVVTDYLGTPVLMLDAGGQVRWSAGMSAYGELRDLEGERYACPFRWPGQYEDAETGLYYNRFRYYDAEAGQYASQDPLRTAAGIRLYGYVSNPLQYSDPLGLIEQVLTEGTVYRGGSDTDSNFTPRPAKDTQGHKRGLSTFDTLERAAKPGEKAQKIDIAKLGPDVEAVLNDDNGHVSIRPKADPGDAKLNEWAATRGQAQAHPMTEQVRRANAGQVKRPDCK